MALSADEIRIAAERLHQAEKTRKQIRQLSLDHPGITIADACAIQKAWIGIEIAPNGLALEAGQVVLADRSFARSKPAKATRFRPTMVPMAR